MLNSKVKSSLTIALLLVTLGFQTVLTTQAEPTIESQLVDHHGVGGKIFFDSQNNPHIIYSEEVADVRDPVIRMQAFWDGKNWSTQVVNNNASNKFIMDTDNNPYIYSIVNDTLKTISIPDSDWTTISNIGISGFAASKTTVLDTRGTLHSVTSDRVYFEDNESYTVHLYYNTWSEEGKSVNVIEEKDSIAQVSSETFIPLVIALDLNGKPNIVYSEKTERSIRLENVEIPVFLRSTQLKYAKWTGSNWNIQTIADNSSNVDLVFDFNGQPHLCYVHQNSTLDPNTGGFWIDGSFEYAHFDGYRWSYSTIEDKTSGMDSGPRLFRIDVNGNPQMFYYKSSRTDQNATGFTVATLIGGEWKKESINWVKPVGSYGNAGVSDMEFDLNGDLHLTYSIAVGTYRSALRYGELTHVYIQTSDLLGTNIALIVGGAAVAVAALTIATLMFRKRKRRKTVVTASGGLLS